MDANKYAKLFLDRKTRMFVIHGLSIRHHNKTYDYKNNNKYRQKRKSLVEKCEKRLSEPFKP